MKRAIFWVFFFALAVVTVSTLHIVNAKNREIEEGLKLRGLQDKADIALRTLEMLKNNDTNTTTFLEEQLDATVIALGDELKTMPESRWDSGTLRLLRGARDYRKRFPDHQLNPALIKAFSVLDRATNN